MPSVSSYADLITDWEELLEAGQRTPPELQQIFEPERLALVESLAEVQALKARQLELTALRQEATQQLRAAQAKGKEVAIQIRSILRGKIGPRSERLVHFRVSPLRLRTRRQPVPPPPLPPPVVEANKEDGENPGTAEGASAPPPMKSAA